MTFNFYFILIALILLVSIAFGVGLYFWTTSGTGQPIFKSIVERARDYEKLRKYRGKPYFDSSSTIFVSIASYRDPECAFTVKRLLEHAVYPERVFIGILQQNKIDKDHDCTELLHDKELAQVRVKTVDAKKARGPLYARSVIIDELFNNEQYYLQIDSHTYPVIGWDVLALQQLDASPSENPVLTCYPDDYDMYNADAPKSKTRWLMRFMRWNEAGIPEFENTYCPEHVCKSNVPTPCLFYAAGFCFASSEILQVLKPLKEISKDVFFGEEVLVALVLFTHGWDLFTPSKPLIYHLWNRDYRPTFWEHQNSKRIEKGKTNVDKILQILQGKTKGQSNNYLGQSKTLKEFETHCGIDFTRKTVDEKAKKGYFE